MKRAESGEAQAQWHMGWLYASGSGTCVPHDMAKAVQWYERAAASGHTAAMVSLGTCYRNGLGVDKDIDRGLQLYRQAAALGQVDAMRRLGTIYYNGFDLLDRDLKEAEKWFRMAYENGDRSAESDLLKILKETNPKQWAEETAQIEAEKKRQLEETAEQKKERLAEQARRRKQAANELFGTIGVALPMADGEVESPTTNIRGTRFKALKALVGIPLGALVGGGQAGPGGAVAGALGAPGAVLSQLSERQVRSLQKRFAAAYESYGDKDLLENFHAQVVSAIAEQLDNPVVKTPLTEASDSASYKTLGNVDTVLEIQAIVAGLQFTGLDRRTVTVTETVGKTSREVQRTKTIEEPKGRFVMIVQYQPISVKNNAPISEVEERSSSSVSKGLSAWTADDGAALREVMQTAYAELASRRAASLLSLAEVQRPPN